MTVLDYVRLANIVLGSIALVLVVSRIRGTRAFPPKRVARYYAYLGLIFWSVQGSAESVFQGAPTGVKTVYGFFLLLFIIYSEWEFPRK